MAKIHYYFDHDTLSINKKKPNYLKILFWYFSVASVFAGVVLLIAYNFFPSPGEIRKTRQLEEVALQIKLINEEIEKLEAVKNDLAQRDDNIYRIIFEAEPVSKEIRDAGFGGINRYEDLEDIKYSELIISTRKRLDKLASQFYIQSKSFDEVYKLAKNKEKMLASIPAIIPIKGGNKQVVSGFGLRVHPIYKTWKMHTGIDIASPRGTPVYASGDGVIVSPPGQGRGYGIYVLIDHGYGYNTLYGHLDKRVVAPGQKVKRGQLIGYVGNTGLSVSPHLHYEVHKNGKKVDPVNYFYNDLTPEEFEELMEVASKENQSLS